MSNLNWLASFAVAVAVIPALTAETRCPGNVESLPFHLANRYQIIVPVIVNHSGPYNFLLDTGAQATIIDPALASELHLGTWGSANVVGVGFQATASFAKLDLLEAGRQAVADQKVLVYELQHLEEAHLEVRGILGEDFLGHFDVLIDNSHKLLCLDDLGTMRTEVKGPRVALAQTGDGTSLPAMLVFSARLTDGMRSVRLKLDSGTDTSFLYNTSEYMALAWARGASFLGRGAGGQERAFAALPPQDINVGAVEISKVSFVTFSGTKKDSRALDFDGLLSLRLFRRVFICHSDHYAVLEPQ